MHVIKPCILTHRLLIIRFRWKWLGKSIISDVASGHASNHENGDMAWNVWMS